MKTKLLLLFSVLLISISLNAQIRYLKGVLQAGQQTDTVVSAASGVVIVKYNTATNVLQLNGNYRNLTATISASHIHGPADSGFNAPVLFDLTNSGGTIGTLRGTAMLTEPQEVELLAGRMYTNVHTDTYPGGEIRAQLTTTTDGQTEQFVARLQGAQEVPPDSSLATGMAYVLVDKTTHMLYLTGSYAGLTSAAVNAHIHRAAPHIAGPVIVPVVFTPTSTGTIDTALTISTTVEADILNGNSYVNVHSGTFPTGELRGQLTQLSQMWFFANALEGSQEFPMNASTARGTVIAKYNSETNVLILTGDYQNLNATISGSHIHGPAGLQENAGILFDVENSGGTIGTLTDTSTLTEAQEAELLAGRLYVNVHSTGTYAAGEIRAQLLPTTMGQTQYITGLMQASQSVDTPAVVSSGTGTATVLLDRVTLKVFTTANFTGLTSNITNAHIHRGPAGTNGPVAVPLSFAGTTSGTVTGTATVSSTFADSMINGLSYINIHTVNFGAGEIRAQLGNLILPLKLTFFNAYKDDDKVALLWQSADEINVSHYEIQQQDATTSQWVTKKSVNALNNGFANNYKDIDIPFTSGSVYVYYRLKMIDKDGRYYFSPIMRINIIQPNAELMLVSNPVRNNQLQYLITGVAINKKAKVSIVDFNGRTVFQTIAFTMANNYLSVGKLSAGMYKLVVQIDDKIMQKSFIK
jgi:hypothetical protein